MVGSRAPSARMKNMTLLIRARETFQPNFHQHGANSSAITPM